MNKFLEDFSLTIQCNRHVALLMDNAGWHTAKKLTVPSNITLIPLPPYAPELNAMEQVWGWIKNHFLISAFNISHQFYLITDLNF